LPRDYAGLPKNVPKLGPPLPSDLGRPILATQSRLSAAATVDPEEQRIGHEREAARTAKLFAPTNAHVPPRRARFRRRVRTAFLRLSRAGTRRSSI
jgi:type IV secretory pathway VirB10-like protein